jgi:hypothetical protein
VNLHGVSDAVLGGWTVNGILYLGTGVPIAAPMAGGSPSFFTQRADLACNPATPHSILQTGTSAGLPLWVSYGCFVKPGTENGGNANHLIPGDAATYLDHVRTRGAREFDMSIYKTLKLTETKALRFDVSAYNLSNTPQFGYPNIPSVNSLATPISQGNTVNPNSFGMITNNVNTPRQFQFGARFTF